jgi:hypothetical protein
MTFASATARRCLAPLRPAWPPECTFDEAFAAETGHDGGRRGGCRVGDVPELAPLAAGRLRPGQHVDVDPRCSRSSRSSSAAETPGTAPRWDEEEDDRLDEESLSAAPRWG